MFIHSRSSLENHTRFQTKKAQNPGTAHTYMASIREYPWVLTKLNFWCNVKVPSKIHRYLKVGAKLLAPPATTLC